MTNEDYKTDDEEMRMDGLTDGPKIVNGIQFQPVTGLTMAFLDKHKFFEDDELGRIEKLGMFGYIHSASNLKIRSVIQNRKAFFDAVYDWISDNLTDQDSRTLASGMMAEALEYHLSATTRAANPSGGEPTAKN